MKSICESECVKGIINNTVDIGRLEVFTLSSGHTGDHLPIVVADVKWWSS